MSGGILRTGDRRGPAKVVKFSSKVEEVWADGSREWKHGKFRYQGDSIQTTRPGRKSLKEAIDKLTGVGFLRKWRCIDPVEHLYDGQLSSWGRGTIGNFGILECGDMHLGICDHDDCKCFMALLETAIRLGFPSLPRKPGDDGLPIPVPAHEIFDKQVFKPWNGRPAAGLIRKFKDRRPRPGSKPYLC